MSSRNRILAAHLLLGDKAIKALREQLRAYWQSGNRYEAYLADLELPTDWQDAVKRQLAYAKALDHQIIDCLDTRYPSPLKELYDFPLVLFCNGQCERLGDNEKFAIVGTRKPSYDGKKMTDQAVKHLAKRPYTIVSGLAYGIDSLAHRAALRYNCPTIAVLASPVDQVTPANHRKLAEQILQAGGLIISETPYNSATLNHFYVRRNRIVSGISDKVFIVEGAIKSGSMTTAQHCADQNKLLYVMPGSISNPVAHGTNLLLKQGAIPVTEPNDLMNLESVVSESVDCDHPIAQRLMEEGQLGVEQLAMMLDIPIHALLSELMVLECDGIVTVVDNHVVLL